MGTAVGSAEASDYHRLYFHHQLHHFRLSVSTHCSGHIHFDETQL